MKTLSLIKLLFFKTYRLFISLKLAIFTISAWAFLTGLGTFVESRYDQETANKLIYNSFFMHLVLLLLATNLMFVLIDRWPWRKRHIGFVLAHVGLLIIMLGSVFTHRLGIDGSLRFKEGEKSSSVSVLDMELKIYSSYDGQNFSLLYEKPLDLFFIKPSKKKPFIINTGGEQFVIDKYLPFALGREQFKAVTKGGSPAIRFHLSGSQADIVEWMYLEAGEQTLKKNFGPATLTLTKNLNYKPKKKTELVLFIKEDKIFYSSLKTFKKHLQKKTEIKPGSVFNTNWMDFKFRLLEYFPKAQREFIFESQSRPSDLTVKAFRINYQNETVWLGQNSHVRFFKKDKMYAVAYLNKTYPLNFNLELLDFKTITYPGSPQAKAYQSKVRLYPPLAWDLAKKQIAQAKKTGTEKTSQLKPKTEVEKTSQLKSKTETEKTSQLKPKTEMKSKQSSTNTKNQQKNTQQGSIEYQDYVISMNKPLKYGGFTLYQASFEPARSPGEPEVSILAVNKDPGRVLKYIGSALVVLGIMILFYRRKFKNLSYKKT